ncbi:MAG: glycosyl hydrolase family 8 [Acidimicrobiales bacterium]
MMDMQNPWAADSRTDGKRAHGSARSLLRGRLTRASLVATSVVVLGSVLLSSCASPVATQPTTTQSTVSPELRQAKFLAGAFLNRYVASDGRVIRYDQGGDTVSEGQAYSLLLAVATGESARFASVWTWEKDNLQEPNGLFAYHWSNGAVVGAGAATDADLDTAWALVLGARAFHRPAYRKAGLAVASAILANETVVSDGRLELVAGPWARIAPYTVDPSYFSPEAMAALAAASGDRRWRKLALNSQRLVADLQGGGSTRSLPPDWALLSTSGEISASSSPSSGGPPSYGLDAQRVPIWYAADCSASGRALSADNWPTISGLAGSGSYQAYSLTGAVQVQVFNNLGLIAASASADSAGQTVRGRSLLAQAQSVLGQTYYGDAWVALGTVLLTTNLLSPCPPGGTS